MAKKVIQVPVDESLLQELEELSRKQRRTRSEVIRRACERYVREAELAEMDKAYVQGYESIPETETLGEAQAAIAGEFLPEESW
ncbi:MAG: ribbon-helix-helix protein, CopG family [Chloroflexi bacterium]|nr:ribbon-helix-helix protein, CopG family [Chloroflexota bacterium]